MVVVRYFGLSDPRKAFAELKPYRSKLIQMGMNYRPYSEDHLAIHAAIDALDKAAERFVGENAVRGLYASTDGSNSTRNP